MLPVGPTVAFPDIVNDPNPLFSMHVNRVSPSAYLRSDTQAIFHAHWEHVSQTSVCETRFPEFRKCSKHAAGPVSESPFHRLHSALTFETMKAC